jgi:hypothetical protein
LLLLTTIAASGAASATSREAAVGSETPSTCLGNIRSFV